MKRALWLSRRGTTEEAASTPPFLAIAAVLVLFSLALMGRWFYLYFIEAPDTFDGYAKANLDRLSSEIETMLKEPSEMMEYREYRVIPYSLIGYGFDLQPKVRSLIGINPRLSPPESEGCDPEGEVEFPNFCKRYACLCLCDGTKCTGKNACKAFKPGDVDADVRFVGIDQPYRTGFLGLDVNRFNTGRRLSTTEDPLRLDNLYELILFPYCESSSGRGWGLDGSEDTGYLYVEETRSDDGKYTYILIARNSDEARRRARVIDGQAAGESGYITVAFSGSTSVDYKYVLMQNKWQYNGGLGWADVSGMSSPYVQEHRTIAATLTSMDEEAGTSYLSSLLGRRGLEVLAMYPLGKDFSGSMPVTYRFNRVTSGITLFTIGFSGQTNIDYKYSRTAGGWQYNGGLGWADASGMGFPYTSEQRAIAAALAPMTEAAGTSYLNSLRGRSGLTVFNTRFVSGWEFNGGTGWGDVNGMPAALYDSRHMAIAAYLDTATEEAGRAHLQRQ